VNGVRGKSEWCQRSTTDILVVNETGNLHDFFKVYVTAQTKAHVLCFADVENLYEITNK